MTSILKVDEIQNTDGKTGIVITPDGSLESVKFPEQSSPSGRVITSTTMSSYETGTFIPTLTFGKNSAGQSYQTRVGYYTKIGSAVTVTLYILLTSKGTSTGTAEIAGMPFKCKGGLAYSVGSLHINQVSYSGFPQAYLQHATFNVNLGTTSESGTFSTLDNNNFVGDSGIIFTATYQTNE